MAADHAVLAWRLRDRLPEPGCRAPLEPAHWTPARDACRRAGRPSTGGQRSVDGPRRGSAAAKVVLGADGGRAPALDADGDDDLATAAARLLDVGAAQDGRPVRRLVRHEGFCALDVTARSVASSPAALLAARWVDRLDTLEPLRAGLSTRPRRCSPARSGRRTPSRAFDRGLAAASVTERRDATGLDLFDGRATKSRSRRFADGSRPVREPPGDSAARRAAGQTAVPTRRRRRARSAALQPRTRPAQRGGLSVRELLEQYGDVITEITPCVLVARTRWPGSSRPGRRTFDLVVFDEASQIRVRRRDRRDGPGARRSWSSATRKQMPPTTFAQQRRRRRSTDGTDGERVDGRRGRGVASSASASRPGAAGSGCPGTTAARTSRSSRSPTSRTTRTGCRSFPAPPRPARLRRARPRRRAGPGGRAVHPRRPTGRLLRTNPVEATGGGRRDRRAGCSDAGDAPSIGVVTFNAQQRDLIEALLGDSDDERIAEALRPDRRRRAVREEPGERAGRRARRRSSSPPRSPPNDARRAAAELRAR